jgi:tRNA 2-thiouridine synthesizing protein A
MQKQLFDFTGLKCPLPVLKARRALKSMAIGQLAEITADDPAGPNRFSAFLRYIRSHA